MYDLGFIDHKKLTMLRTSIIDMPQPYISFIIMGLVIVAVVGVLKKRKL
jgi:hypothetical protein